VNRSIVKSLTYYPINNRLASLRPDSGVNTLRVMKSVCAVKFSKSLDITLSFLRNLIDSKRLNSTIISNELN